MKVRESNIELLRIVLMTIIIVWHLFVYGESFLQTLTTPSIYIAPLLVFRLIASSSLPGSMVLNLNETS